jgi:acyl carrier protein
MTSIGERITRILLDDFKVRPEAMGADTTFGDLNFDSLVIVELALVLDKEFDIELDDGELTDAMTVADAAELVSAKVAVKGAAA